MSTVSTKPAKSTRKPRSAKQVRLRLVHLDFWSTTKMAFLVGLALAVIQIVVTVLVYGVLSATGMLGKLASLAGDVAGGAANMSTLVSLPVVVGFTLVSAVLQIIVTAALGAIVAILYNLAVKVTGGILVGFTNE